MDILSAILGIAIGVPVLVLLFLFVLALVFSIPLFLIARKIRPEVTLNIRRQNIHRDYSLPLKG